MVARKEQKHSFAQSADAVECTGCASAEGWDPQWVSWLWHWAVWWWGSGCAGALGSAECPFVAISPGSAGVVAPGGALSVGWVELAVYLSWTELFELELFDWAEWLEVEVFLILNMYLRLTDLFGVELFWHLAVCEQDQCLYWAELSELELFD